MPTSSGSHAMRMIDATGASATVVPRVFQVVGPASYATGGIPIDCSAYFSRILAATFLRRFTTATGVNVATSFCLPGEAGTDTYANAKFRLVESRAPTVTGTNTAPAFTGNAIGGAHACGAVGCDSSHPNSTTVPAGTVAAPVWTTSSSTSFTETAAAVNLSSITYEFLVWGVPK